MKTYLKTVLTLALFILTTGLASAVVSFDATKLYSIRNADSNKYLTLQTGHTETGVVNASPLETTPCYFNLIINTSGTKYAIKYDKYYLALSTNANYSGWNTRSTTSASYAWTIEETETIGQYRLKCTKGYLKYDGSNGYAYTNGGTNDKVNWVIEEFIPYATDVTTDKYYRLTNVMYNDRILTENYGDNTLSGLGAAEAQTPYSQIWKLTKSSDLSGTVGKWKLTNLLTGRKIASQATTSAQFKTTTSGADFVVQKGNASTEKPYFTFGLAKDGAGLHCASSKSIVNWAVSAEASRWYLQEIELSEAQLEEAAAFYKSFVDSKSIVTELNKSTNRTAYHAIFNQVFTDLSCSEFKPEYLALSAGEQNTIIESLPDLLKEMINAVKSSTWDSSKDAKYNGYVKNFRINSYEPYSDRAIWRTITNVGPFGQLVNPTGITVKTGEVICVYVEKLPGSGATIKLEIASDTDHTGEQFTLKQGINAIQATKDGELFVAYFVTNKDKYVVATKDHAADYLPIRVHIEGGHATGTWDMHRGMNNEDWDYLSKNMFGAEFLHVKGESTVLSVLTKNVIGAPNVEGIMKIWDFIFDTEERLIGHDGQWDGRYRPVITPRHSYQGNPNWGGNGGTNHPSISRDYLFNFEKMVNDVGHLWEIYHEEAHAHQYPINLAATTESSNNGYAQMTNYEFGSYNSRNKGVETLVIFKNNDWGWVDILRAGEGCSRTEGFQYYDQALWLQCHMFFQLYQYFHIQGYMPDFWPRVADAMRSNGGITYGRSATAPGYYYNDYLKFAKVCAEVSQTDLWEFFDTWGFFSYCDEVKVGNDYKKPDAQYFKNNDRPDLGVRFVGDYGSYYLRMPIRGNAQDEKYLADLKTEMQAYSKKAPGLMFIDDHIKDMTVTDTCFVATIYPSLVGKTQKYYGVTRGTSGDVGMFWEFDGVNRADCVYYTIVGNKVTMHGSGYLGIKIYNETGDLIRIYNTTQFTLDSSVTEGLNNGTYKMYAPLGDNTQMEVHRDFPEGVTFLNADNTVGGKAYDLCGRNIRSAQRGSLIIKDGKKTLVR